MNGKHTDAARVWQRVLAPAPQEQQTLQFLARQLSLDQGYLKQLSKGNDDRTLGQLVQEYASQLRCLRGILKLSGGSLPGHVPASPPDHSLGRCFDHALQRLAACQIRSSDPVYGPVFRELAKQTEHHCRCITELLGSNLKEGKEKGR